MSRRTDIQPPRPLHPDQDHTSDSRLTEQPNPRTIGIDTAGTAEILELLFAEDLSVPAAVAAESANIGDLVDQVFERLREGGRLLYVGAGTSGRLGVIDAAECPPTFGTPPELVTGIIAGGFEALVRSREGAEDDREAGRAAMRDAGVDRNDFVLGIAASGTTPFVLAAIGEAAALGAGTGILTCTPPPAEIASLVDVRVTPLTGPEAITGSTRLKAGTATKLVLNAVTTAVMVRAGKVFGNRMVDLQARSEKLADRSMRILADVAGIDPNDGAPLLVRAGGSVKTALLMHATGVDRNLAERRLDAAEGRLGAALERFPAGSPERFFQIYERSDTPSEQVLDRFAAGPERVRAAVADRIRSGDPAMGGRHPWSPARHVRHLIACETGMIRPRIEAVIAGEDEIVTFTGWQEPAADGEPGSVGAMLDEWTLLRAGTVELLRSAAADVLERRARLCEEELSLRQFLLAMSQHDRAHATRITEWLHPSILPESVG